MNDRISQLPILIKKGNLDKAGSLLGEFPGLPEKDQQKIMEILALSPNPAALFLLEVLLDNETLTEKDRAAVTSTLPLSCFCCAGLLSVSSTGPCP